MKKLVNILLTSIIVCCLVIIGHRFYNYKKDGDFNSEIQDIAGDGIKNISNNVEEDIITSSNNDNSSNNNQESNEDSININEEKLKEINNHYKMWIKVNNTEINYPVVQGEDNDFYLNHNFKRETNLSGTIFADYQNNINEDKNIIIYGHNMRNGSMFNNIGKYKDKDFFYNNNIINIIRDGQLYRYEVFSVYIENGDETNFTMSFASDELFLDYINKERKKSIYKKDIDITADSKILTLVTCSYEFNDARTIVIAKLI